MRQGLWSVQSHAVCALLQALVIGTDIPDISASILERAVASLDSHEVAFLQLAIKQHKVQTNFMQPLQRKWRKSCMLTDL